MTISWCRNCNVPINGTLKCTLCGNITELVPLDRGEIKPIFGAEKEFFQSIVAGSLGERYAGFLDAGLAFFTRSGEVIIDGKKVFRIHYDSHKRLWTSRFTKSYERNPFYPLGTELKVILRANTEYIHQKERESVSFLRETRSACRDSPPVVSFSGGKDSTVVLALTKRICRSPQAIFINTTIEFDETVQYSRAICEAWGVQLHELTPPTDFMYLVEKLGPPSRLMRWCCKTQKFGPLNRFVTQQYPKGVLMVSGIRKAESNSRSKLSKIQTNHMVPKEKLVFPILDWSSLDVWLYLLAKRIPYNPLYDYGYRRIGCWACPEKSSYDSGLVGLTHPDLEQTLGTALRQFALSRGLDNAEDWIASGTWKQWRTHWQQSVGCTAGSCGNEGGITYRFEDSRLVTRAAGLMRVFGKTRHCALGSIIDGRGIHIVLTGSAIRATFGDKRSRRIFERQLRKALNCVGCGACVGACPRGAISVADGFVSVSEKCCHCLKCLTSNGIRMTCVALNYKPDILSVQHRGIIAPTDCASQARRYQALEPDSGSIQEAAH